MFAAAMLGNQRMRDALFGADLFANPAWDILLQLHAAEQGGRTLDLSQLSAHSGQSVLRRWIAVLIERELVTVQPGDPRSDSAGRIELTPEARAKIDVMARQWA
jgi:hypothetical protein